MPCTRKVDIMRIVFLGDSHTHALIRALAKSDKDKELDAVDVRRIKDGQTNDKEIPANLASIYPADAVYCCLGGTEYNLLGLIESPAPFDFLLTPDDSVLPGRQVVSHGLVKAALLSRMRSALNRTAEIRAQYDCPFTLVAPPPPFAELDGNTNLPRAFLPYLDRGIAPASVRRKLYAIQMLLLEEHCREEGLPLMLAPEEARDADGYLRRNYWNNDPTHGNANYGKAVIGQIRSLQFA